MKKLFFILCLSMCMAASIEATEFDADSDGVFDDDFKFDVDNLVDATVQIPDNSRSILKAANYSAIRLLLGIGTTDSPSFAQIYAEGSSAPHLQVGLASTTDGVVRFKNASNTNQFNITSGASGANIGWTLPTAAPAGNDYLLRSSTTGVLSYVNPASIGGSSTFGALTDAFALAGNGSKLVAVKSDASGLEPISTLSLDDSAAQIYDSSDPDKKILIEAGGLPTSTTAQMSPIEYIHVTVVKPQDLADAVRDSFVIWSNDSGKNFVIQGWKAWAGADNTTLAIKTMTASGGSITTVDAVEVATDGTSIYYATDTTITSATIANGNLLFLDFDDTDDPSYVKVTIYGYFAN